MIIEHDCYLADFNLPEGVQRVKVTQRCSVCGQLWRTVAYSDGGYYAERLKSFFNLKLYRWNRNMKRVMKNEGS